MNKLIITLALLLGSTNVLANVSCGKGSWVTPPKFVKKILVTNLRGTCTIKGEGDLEKLKEHYLNMVTDGPEVREVHTVKEKDTFTTVVDSTQLSSMDGDILEARYLTQVSVKDNKLTLNKATTKIIKGTGNNKYIRNITDNFKVSKTADGFKVVITLGVNIKIPKFAKKMALKQMQKQFPEGAKAISNDILENL